MPLLDDIKASLRVTTDRLDNEISMLVDAALYDMGRVGIDPELLEKESEDLSNPFVKQAVTAYVKAHSGYDVTEAPRFDAAYRRIVCDLLNSAANTAAKDGE